MTLDELPQACAARWYRSRARAGTAPGPPGDLAAFYASDGGCRRLVDDRVAALRSSRPSVDRDAALARWLEWLARSGGPARRDRLAEAAGLAARAAAVAARREADQRARADAALRDAAERERRRAKGAGGPPGGAPLEPPSEEEEEEEPPLEPPGPAPRPAPGDEL